MNEDGRGRPTHTIAAFGDVSWSRCRSTCRVPCLRCRAERVHGAVSAFPLSCRSSPCDCVCLAVAVSLPVAVSATEIVFVALLSPSRLEL